MADGCIPCCKTDVWTGAGTNKKGRIPLPADPSRFITTEVGVSLLEGYLDLADVCRRGTLGTILDGEFDAVAFGQAAEALALDGGMVYKDILAPFDGQEAEALLITKPLDGASSKLLTHCWKLLRFRNGFLDTAN